MSAGILRVCPSGAIYRILFRKKLIILMEKLVI